MDDDEETNELPSENEAHKGDSFCGEMDPEKAICLNKPHGKGIIEEDCLGNDYTPAKGLNQMLAYLKDKKANPKDSTIETANCYKPDLGWLVVIQDIINRLDVEIKNKKPEPTPESTISLPLSEENTQTDNEFYKNQIKGVLEEMKQNVEVLNEIKGPSINLIELFEGIIQYGLKKWEIDNVEFQVKCETNDCTYLTKHADDKDSCIGFLILRFFQDLIVLPGFIDFSNYIMDPSKMDLSKLDPSKMDPSKMDPSKLADLNSNPNYILTEADVIKKIQEVFKMALFIMNEKNQLSNYYGGMDVPKIFDTIQETFKSVENVFNIYSVKSDVIKGGSEASQLLYTDEKTYPWSGWDIPLIGFHVAWYTIKATYVIIKSVLFGAFSIKHYFKYTSKVRNFLKEAVAKFENLNLYVSKPENGAYKVYEIYEHDAFIKDYYKIRYEGYIQHLPENIDIDNLFSENKKRLNDVTFKSIWHHKTRKVNLIPYTYQKGDENIEKSIKNNEERKRKNEDLDVNDPENEVSAEGADQGGMKKRNHSKKIKRIKKRKTKKYGRKKIYTKRRKIIRPKKNKKTKTKKREGIKKVYMNDNPYFDL